MKKFLLLIIAFQLSYYGISQTIEYNFETRDGGELNLEVGDASPVMDGEFLVFKVTNINTFRYKVSITGKNYDYATAIPSELQTLFRISNNTLEKGIQETENVVGELEGALDAMNTIADEASGNSAMANMDAVFPDLVGICEDYQAQIKLLAKYKYDRLELVKLSKMSWKNHSRLLTAINTRVNIPDNEIDNFDEFYSDLFGLYEKAENQYESAIDAAEKDIAVATTAGNMALVTSLTKKRDKIQEKLDGILENWELVEEDDIVKLLQDLSILSSALKDPSNFTVASAPIQADGDYINFAIKIEPSQVSDLLPYETSYEFPVSVKTKGGWRADFSVGPTLSIGKASRDLSFFLEKSVLTDSEGIPTQIDSVGVLRERDAKDSARPGIAAMIHAYRRSGKSANWGWMLGVGAGFQSIEDPDVALYTGPTVVTGKREKFMFSFGASLHRVARLNEEFSLGTSYPVDEVNTEDLTTRIFKPSVFISLSYSLATRRIN